VSETENLLVEDAGEMVLNMGPHHPSTHGVIRLIIHADGEVVRRVDPDIGYLHRGIEKIAEGLPFPAFMPYTDRVDYLGAMFMNHGYAMAVERLAGIDVPPRAEHLRVLADELNRIASHLICLGSITMDLGAYTPFLNGVREREKVNDIIEELCGARLTYNYMRIGGVAFDLTPGLSTKILDFLDGFEVFLDEFNRLITYNAIFVKRCANVGVITADEAKGFGLVGPNLRASGVDFDVRRDVPYSIYPQLEFDVITGHGSKGQVGDVFDRFLVRIEEMRQSMRLVRQVLARMPLGPILGKAPKKIKVDKVLDAQSRIESARGDTLTYLVSDGTEKPYRLKIRTGSFTGLSILSHKAPGMMIGDLVAFFASLDVIAPETDR
jgi:NADH-quinone oxidoreductase subunit D